MLKIIVGRSGYGKTQALLDDIKKYDNQGHHCILIVPDGNTFEYEKKLLLAGCVNSEAISVSRLVERMLSRLGGKNKIFLGQQGKNMAVRKLLEENKNNLEAFNRVSTKSGFSDELLRLIGQLKGSRICPDDLQLAFNDSNTPLQKKMCDIALLFDKLNQYLDGDYIDTYDAQEMAINKLEKASMFENHRIYIDALSAANYYKQVIDLTIQLARQAKQVCISLKCSFDGGDGHIFENENRLAASLKVKAIEAGVDCEILEIKGNRDKFPSGISQLEKRLFTYDKGIASSDEGISIYQADKPQREVLFCIEKIADLINQGEDCNKIAIAMGDESYSPLLKRKLEQYRLPYFIGEGSSLGAQKAAVHIISALKSVKNNFMAHDVIAALKSLLFYGEIERQEAEIFEDYVSQMGIRFSEFEVPFQKGGEKFKELREEAEKLRLKFIPPIIKLKDELQKSKQVDSYICALINYLEEINLYGQIEKHCESLRLAGNHSHAQQAAQIWNLIMETLDQMMLIMSSEKCSVEKFIKILGEGFDVCEIKLIPAMTRQINIGNVQSLSAYDNIDYLFILGCNEGNIPKTGSTEGIINDSEIEEMRKRNLEVFLPVSFKAAAAKQAAYSCFSRAKKGIFVCCSKASQNGTRLEASMLFERLKELFPNKIEAFEPTLSDIIGEKERFNHWVIALRSLADCQDKEKYANYNERLKEIAAVHSYFKKDSKYEMQIDFCKKMLNFRAASIDKSYAKNLYNKAQTTSVSRIEQFNQCPFKHLISYGIDIEQKHEYQEMPMDEGNYFHQIADEFTRRAIEENLWKQMDKIKCDGIIDEICNKLEADHNFGILKRSRRTQAHALELRNSAKATLYAITRQINAGIFTPIMSEAQIGIDTEGIILDLGEGKSISLSGKIDRIDAAKIALNVESQLKEEIYLRIVDYKRGNSQFDYNQLISGTKLQLPIYIQALEKLGKAAGMFYLRINDPIIEQENEDNFDKFKLRGVVVDKKEIINAMDGDMEGSSAIIPAKLLKDGLIIGNGVISQKTMELILRYAKNKLIKSATEIISGKNSIEPIKMGKNSACDYCSFNSICRFEPKRFSRYKTIQKMDDKEAVKLIEEECTNEME